MSQPKKWFIGLIPVAGLLLAAGAMRQGNVEADLATRGGAKLAESGLEWAKVAVAGRDAVITGEAPEPNLRALAISAADRTFGIRNVVDKTTVLPEAKPYTLSAVKDGNAITLTGFVPNAAARAAVEEAAKKANPGANITNNLKFARGAPANLVQSATFGLGELNKLSGGAISLVDSSLSVHGRAADLPKFTDIEAKLAALPAGLKLTKGLAPGDILPPVIKPFHFSAEKTAASITLTGFAPNEQAKAALGTAATASGKSVINNLVIADGAPAGDWQSAGSKLVAELAKLNTGKAVLSDNMATISGVGALGVNEDVVKGDLKALPTGFSLVKADIDAGVIRPYLLNIARGEGAITLTGFVPDAKARGEIVGQAKKFFEGDRIDDKLVEGPGAPKDFVAVAKAGLQDLSRLLPGSSFNLSDANASLKGMAQFDHAREQIATQFRRNVPGGFNSAVEIAVAPLPPPITSSPECDLLYKDVLSRAPIRFRTASAELSEESLGLLDRLTVVTLRCSHAKIEIGGHTDSDGSPQANAELSRRRAEAVASHMVRAGIPVERLEAVGYGETKPVAANDSAENKAKNRRIEFVVK